MAFLREVIEAWGVQSLWIALPVLLIVGIYILYVVRMAIIHRIRIETQITPYFKLQIDAAGQKVPRPTSAVVDQGKASAFGRRLRQLRKQRRLLQNDLAEILGVTPSYISLVETGRTRMLGDEVAILIEAFNLSKTDESDFLRLWQDSWRRQ